LENVKAARAIQYMNIEFLSPAKARSFSIDVQGHSVKAEPLDQAYSHHESHKHSLKVTLSKQLRPSSNSQEKQANVKVFAQARILTN
jgi:hypothetical protein